MHHILLRYYLVFCLIIPSAAFANWAVDSTPVAVQGGTINSSGQVVSMNTYKATHPTKGTMYMDRLTAYNKGTSGTLAARSIKYAPSRLNGLNLLITGALIGVGYFLDSITNDIYTVQPIAEQPLTTANQLYYATYIYQGTEYRHYSNDPYSSTLASMAARGYISTGTKVCPSPYFGCHGASGGLTFGSLKYTSSTLPVINGTTTFNANQQASPGTLATPEQVHDALFPPPKWTDAGYLGDILPELLHDPVTNAPIKTQETADIANQLANTMNTAENPEYVPTTPEVVPEPSQDTSSVATTYPSFCAWATPVCAFIDWVREDDSDEPDPNEVSLPEDQLTYETPTWSSGLGNGSCPAPTSFNVFNSQFSFSYEPFCDLAGMIRYLVIMLAYISAALIISGGRNNVV